jgi:hypothetical protein
MFEMAGFTPSERAIAIQRALRNNETLVDRTNESYSKRGPEQLNRLLKELERKKQ